MEARFYGKNYPVTGSSLADAIAYAAVNWHKIAGVGKKNGVVALRETITASEAEGRTLTPAFAIFS